MKGLWQLKVRDNFAAAHALRHYQGKCEKMHGHNFAVEVCVEGSDLDPQTEILLDFKVLKNILKNILNELDHNNLNETAYFLQSNPSSENLARHIWEEMTLRLKDCPDPQTQKVRLAWVSVSEKDAQSAIYFGSDPG